MPERQQTHLGSCPLCSASMESQPVGLGGWPDIAYSLILEKKKAAGEGGDGLPPRQVEGMLAASARVLLYQLPAMPFLFFFLL